MSTEKETMSPLNKVETEEAVVSEIAEESPASLASPSAKSASERDADVEESDTEPPMSPTTEQEDFSPESYSSDSESGGGSEDDKNSQEEAKILSKKPSNDLTKASSARFTFDEKQTGASTGTLQRMNSLNVEGNPKGILKQRRKPKLHVRRKGAHVKFSKPNPRKLDISNIGPNELEKATKPILVFGDQEDASNFSKILPQEISKQKGVIVDKSPNERYVKFNEVLGEGSFKKVYLGYDTKYGVEVAWNHVKMSNMKGAAQLRVLQEMKILQKLKHISIMRFYSSWFNRQTNVLCFITELMSSGTLKDFVMNRPVRLRIVKRWCRHILNALVYLHEEFSPPIIHRDLKCDNIFINGNSGEIRIGDLGLASWERNGNAKSVLGTPEYMAPEMFDENYDEKVDVYSFGMVVLEMLTKTVPYMECTSTPQIYRKVMEGRAPDTFYTVRPGRVKEFIWTCIKKPKQGISRPSAREVRGHPLLQKKKDEEEEKEDNVDVETLVMSKAESESIGNFVSVDGSITCDIEVEEGEQTKETGEAKKGKASAPASNTAKQDGSDNASEGSFSSKKIDSLKQEFVEGNGEVETSDRSNETSDEPQQKKSTNVAGETGGAVEKPAEAKVEEVVARGKSFIKTVVSLGDDVEVLQQEVNETPVWVRAVISAINSDSLNVTFEDKDYAANLALSEVKLNGVLVSTLLTQKEESLHVWRWLAEVKSGDGASENPSGRVGVMIVFAQQVDGKTVLEKNFGFELDVKAPLDDADDVSAKNAIECIGENAPSMESVLQIFHQVRDNFEFSRKRKPEGVIQFSLFGNTSPIIGSPAIEGRVEMMEEDGDEALSVDQAKLVRVTSEALQSKINEIVEDTVQPMIESALTASLEGNSESVDKEESLEKESEVKKPDSELDADEGGGKEGVSGERKHSITDPVKSDFGFISEKKSSVDAEKIPIDSTDLKNDLLDLKEIKVTKEVDATTQKQNMKSMEEKNKTESKFKNVDEAITWMLKEAQAVQSNMRRARELNLLTDVVLDEVRDYFQVSSAKIHAARFLVEGLLESEAKSISALKEKNGEIEASVTKNAVDTSHSPQNTKSKPEMKKIRSEKLESLKDEKKGLVNEVAQESKRTGIGSSMKLSEMDLKSLNIDLDDLTNEKKSSGLLSNIKPSPVLRRSLSSRSSSPHSKNSSGKKDSLGVKEEVSLNGNSVKPNEEVDLGHKKHKTDDEAFFDQFDFSSMGTVDVPPVQDTSLPLARKGSLSLEKSLSSKTINNDYSDPFDFSQDSSRTGSENRRKESK